MSKNALVLITIILISLGFSGTSTAQPLTGMAPPQQHLPLPPADPFTVTDVLVDKTAQNAVIAREEAIVEAQRSAFQKLAERNLDPKALKDFVLPDDKTIASVVQDFEIKNEQLSFTRYAANFTVRFRDGVRNFVNIRIPETVVAEGGDGVGMMEVKPSRFVLVLPYFENISGKTLLWEDPNPWREAWQSGVAKGEGGKQFFVPLGDIGDVSAGSSDVVWSGDYTVVENLRKAYKADEVILAVANRSASLMTIELYSWKDGKFDKRETLKPFIGDLISEQDAYKIAANEVVKTLQKPVMVPRPIEAAAAISREIVAATPEAQATETALTPEETAAVSGATDAAPQTQAAAVPTAILASSGSSPVPLPTGPAAEVDATMSFTDFSRWMEMQKRLAKMAPPVKVDIRSINKGGASFTMKFQGTVDILKKALADHGIALTQPAVTVDPSVLGGGAPARPVYDLQLVD